MESAALGWYKASSWLHISSRYVHSTGRPPLPERYARN
ncbi:hypothetical protein [Myxococcus phage Mx1]|nr:hypothetical protein [Myxococcus phage Mx1]